MTMSQAIVRAKQQYQWAVTPQENACAEVTFKTMHGKQDDVLLDLYSGHKEDELTEMFDILAAELNTTSRDIICVKIV